MPWNGGLYPADIHDPLFDSINRKIYEQYETYSNKTEALLACLNDPNCPWVFDEKCDGIGPFVIGFRAKITFNCPKSRRIRYGRQSCNEDCIFEKGLKLLICLFI